jgi:hypothetical protein
MIAEAKWFLAQALWDGGGDRARALDLARAARDGYTAGGEAWRPDVARVESWLAARGGGG